MDIHVGNTMSFLPPMTGNGNHTTYKNGDDRGMVYGIVSPTLDHRAWVCRYPTRYSLLMDVYGCFLSPQ